MPLLRVIATVLIVEQSQHGNSAKVRSGLAIKPLQQHVDSKPDQPIARIATAGRIEIRYVKKIDCGNVVRYPCETHLINCFGDCHDR